MGGHHKKNLRAEKAKVKLKGAKLPKGLNVTKTDFKVRKIEIREQLRESLVNEKGQRQLNLKETLSRLKHHSSKYKSEALRNVRDSIKSGQAEHLIGHLGELLQGIASGSLDIEHATRLESFKALDSLMEALSPEAVAPFFHILSSYLRCAMTHIQPAIQEDSLLMLDVLLERVPPKLLAEKSSYIIIGNFIDMISRSRHDQEKSNRLLTLNLGQGKESTIKWRTKVMLRLEQILKTLKEDDSHVTHNSSLNKLIHYDDHKPQYYNVLSPFRVDIRELYAICQEKNVKGKSLQLQRYVEQLMPLIQDNWLEVRPQQQQQQQKDQQQHHHQLLLSMDAAASLSVLVNLMTQLWSLIHQYESTNNTQELSKWLVENYSKKFLNNFLENDASNFPYHQMPEVKKKSGKSSLIGGEYCYQQNLSLIYLTCKFLPQPNQAKLFKNLINYLHITLSHLKTLNPFEQLQVVEALRCILLDLDFDLLDLVPQELKDLLSFSMEAYEQQGFTTREGVANRMLSLLSEVIQQERLYRKFGGNEKFVNFLNYLPQLLMKPSINEGTLRAMATLSRQMNSTFLNALIVSAPQILQNLEKLQIAGGGQIKYENQTRILNFFYYAKQLEGNGDQLRTILAEVQTKNQIDQELMSYFQSLITYN
ncbi:uncharacterized protein Dwil_GK14830 [Drosophila willistoni]|uniref:Pre-rRNA-processing protein Ipi1 N-terminal domain-containing protein n=1 Tax=Drosophila willistoni TaxID=7260 RepID=B4NPM9_DROWI|nr:testis-expressed protein 10 [Drosophila willistoni]EDW86469.1 uncharacterized protein Dwil_GK14830 [Drosophila willistoni]